MKKNKVLIYVPTSSYGHIWLYFKSIIDGVRSIYPVNFELIELGASGLDRDKLTAALKEGAEIISVNGALIDSREEWIQEIIKKHFNSFAFYFKENSG